MKSIVLCDYLNDIEQILSFFVPLFSTLRSAHHIMITVSYLKGMIYYANTRCPIRTIVISNRQNI